MTTLIAGAAFIVLIIISGLLYDKPELKAPMIILFKASLLTVRPRHSGSSAGPRKALQGVAHHLAGGARCLRGFVSRRWLRQERGARKRIVGEISTGLTARGREGQIGFFCGRQVWLFSGSQLRRALLAAVVQTGCCLRRESRSTDGCWKSAAAAFCRLYFARAIGRIRCSVEWVERDRQSELSSLYPNNLQLRFFCWIWMRVAVCHVWGTNHKRKVRKDVFKKRACSFPWQKRSTDLLQQLSGSMLFHCTWLLSNITTQSSWY